MAFFDLLFSRFSLAAVALTVGLGACDVEPAPSGESEAARGPLGKADLISGSCQDAEQNYCGGPSASACWCDDLCESYGDCCSDKALTCDGDPPEPGLCLVDGDCDAAEACDHSECLSPACPDGFACPAVCFGACTPAPPPQPGPLCLTDDACAPGFSCDHSECLSPACPEGFFCPAVCYGECIADVPPTGSCEMDSDCEQDEVCGCAPCPDGFICPAVCIAACVDA